MEPIHFSFIQYRIYPIPLKVAYFIIETIRVAKTLNSLDFPPNSDLQHEEVKVYLTPGTELFGKKIEKLTEIPAELRPVVVEKL